MNIMKIALLGTAALAVASVSARADSLDSLKAVMDNMGIGAVADAPAAAAPATDIVWDGRVRAAVGTVFEPLRPVGTQYSTDIRTNFHLGVTAATQTAVGEVGVKIAIQSGPNSDGNFQANGQGNTTGFPWTNNYLRADGFSGWWKMTPNLTLKAGTLGIQTSSYSWDAVATNWFYARTGGPVIRYGSNNDPAAFGLYYADGPLSFGLQAYDADNAANASAFGVNAKMGYKIDSFGIDIAADYAGRAAGSAGWAIGGGLGYSAGGFSFGAAVGTGAAPITGLTTTPGSIHAKMALSDVARIEMGVTREFAAAGNDTQFGAGIYYSPVKQLTFGLEGGYRSNGLGAASGDGSYSAGLVSAFTF